MARALLQKNIITREPALFRQMLRPFAAQKASEHHRHHLAATGHQGHSHQLQNNCFWIQKRSIGASRFLCQKPSEADPEAAPPTSKCTRKTDVSYEELCALIEEGSIMLIDVREPRELEESGSIPGAINIPLGELKAALSLPSAEFEQAFGLSKPSKEGQGVIFCALTSVKSSTACEIAHKLGFKQSRHLPGGFEEWKARRDQK